MTKSKFTQATKCNFEFHMFSGETYKKIIDNTHGKFKTTVLCNLSSIKKSVLSILDKRIFYIVESDERAKELFKEYSRIYNDNTLLLTSSGDIAIHKDFALLNEDDYKKTVALNALAGKNYKICIASSQSLLNIFPKEKFLFSNTIHLSKGHDFSISEILEKLVNIGYRNSDEIEEKGTFNIRGDIINIFPINKDRPYYLSFFDSTLESIKEYDIDTMFSIKQYDFLEILPATGVFLDNEDINIFENSVKRNIEKLSKVASHRLLDILDDIRYKIEISVNNPSLSWAIPFFRKNYCSIFSYLDKDTILVFDDYDKTLDAMYDFEKNFLDRVNLLKTQGEATETHCEAIEKTQEIKKEFDKHGQILFTKTDNNQALIKLIGSKVTPYYLNYNLLFSDLKRFIDEKKNTAICAGSCERADKVVEFLKKNGFSAFKSNCFSDVNPNSILVSEINTEEGYVLENSVLIGVNEFFGKTKLGKDITKSKKTKRLMFLYPEVNSYVVHDIHGIGKCMGLTRMKYQGKLKDYVLIEYKDNDKLYLPAEQLDKLQRYSGSDKVPTLSKLGGEEFDRIKTHVRRAIKEMAINLLSLYSERHLAKGFKYSKNTIWTDELENSFKYEETADQLNAISEIYKEMEEGIVMDRLLCGDVGYGKTEVAIRAIFKTIMDNKQAVLIAPTTILARQHFDTLKERFDQFQINIALLTRFQTNKEIEASLSGIKSGKVSVIVGTHKILSSKVVFDDLGLLVIDEEQKFGVEQKEKIKALKNNVNVLALSATPIPRTLNMALSGIRDISILETPPSNRQVINTYIVTLTDALIKDVIERELKRDGQVFILNNRISGLFKFAEHVQELVPQAKIVVGHGKMDKTQLENNINKFYSKMANVLICTSIIENGIDIPDANSIIICNADTIGLSSLYQIRGRVGRSHKTAYAYFTTKPNKKITDDGEKRLEALLDYQELGSGFKIAMRDLEIRGAGNFLGKEQHGHLIKVGYDLYCRILEEEVQKLNGVSIASVDNICEILLNIDTYMPVDYIADQDKRLSIHKDIAAVSSKKDMDEIYTRLNDKYGKVPIEVENLIKVAYIKNIAQLNGISKILQKQGEVIFEFLDENCLKNPTLIYTINKFKSQSRLVVNDKNISLVIKVGDISIDNIVAVIIDFLENLL